MDSLKGRIFKFQDNRTVYVGDVLGTGATCVSYVCTIKYSDGNTESAVLKEFLPYGFDTEPYGDGYIRVLPAQSDEFRVNFLEYLQSIKDIRMVLNEINEECLKRYYIVPPDLNEQVNCFNNNMLEYKAENYNSIFIFNEKKHIFCGITLYPFDSRDMSKNISKYSIDERIDVIAKLCLIIDNFHRHNIILVDIKPDNFLYEKDEIGFCLKLFDFDSIVRLDERGKPVKGSRFKGTPGFSAPEILKPKIWNTISRRSDIYSLGSLLLHFVMFESLSDVCRIKLNFVASYFTEQAFKKLIVSNENTRKLLKKEPIPITIGFWQKFRQIVLKAMNNTPTQRYKEQNGQSAMKNLYNDLVSLMEIYKNRGIHPEVMLNMANKLAKLDKIEIDEHIFVNIQEKTP